MAKLFDIDIGAELYAFCESQCDLVMKTYDTEADVGGCLVGTARFSMSLVVRTARHRGVQLKHEFIDNLMGIRRVENIFQFPRVSPVIIELTPQPLVRDQLPL